MHLSEELQFSHYPVKVLRRFASTPAWSIADLRRTMLYQGSGLFINPACTVLQCQLCLQKLHGSKQLHLTHHLLFSNVYIHKRMGCYLILPLMLLLWNQTSRGAGTIKLELGMRKAFPWKNVLSKEECSCLGHHRRKTSSREAWPD